MFVFQIAGREDGRTTPGQQLLCGFTATSGGCHLEWLREPKRWQDVAVLQDLPLCVEQATLESGLDVASLLFSLSARLSLATVSALITKLNVADHTRVLVNMLAAGDPLEYATHIACSFLPPVSVLALTAEHLYVIRRPAARLGDRGAHELNVWLNDVLNESASVWGLAKQVTTSTALDTVRWMQATSGRPLPALESWAVLVRDADTQGCPLRLGQQSVSIETAQFFKASKLDVSLDMLWNTLIESALKNIDRASALDGPGQTNFHTPFPGSYTPLRSKSPVFHSALPAMGSSISTKYFGRTGTSAVLEDAQAVCASRLLCLLPWLNTLRSGSDSAGGFSSYFIPTQNPAFQQPRCSSFMRQILRGLHPLLTVPLFELTAGFADSPAPVRLRGSPDYAVSLTRAGDAEPQTAEAENPKRARQSVGKQVGGEKTGRETRGTTSNRRRSSIIQEKVGANNRVDCDLKMSLLFSVEEFTCVRDLFKNGFLPSIQRFHKLINSLTPEHKQSLMPELNTLVRIPEHTHM